MKKIFSFVVSLFMLNALIAQVDLSYQTPPSEIRDLVDVNLPPAVQIDSKGEYMVLMSRNSFRSIKEMSAPELRLAGLRINPKTNIGSRTRFYNKMEVMEMGSNTPSAVTGLPQDPQLSNFSWSPEQDYMAFTHTTENGVELWVMNIESREARKITEDRINANFGTVYEWFDDGKSLLVKMLPADRKGLIDKAEVVPTGPRISVNEGQKAQNRTYQDLLKDGYDEQNFEQLVRSELYKVDLDGSKKLWKPVAMYRNFDFSPDGNYIMVSSISRPFSYLVPYYRFPTTTEVYKASGEKVTVVEELPLIEEMPKGFDATYMGRRSIYWRADHPATLYWAEALDKGDPAVEAEYRDQVYQWSAPFDGEASELVKVHNRFAGISWGDESVAIVYDRLWKNRNAKTYLFQPEDPKAGSKILYDRNYQDRYNNPGSFVSKRNEYGRYILAKSKNNLYLTGPGYSPEGIRPFFDKLNIKNQKSSRVWQADGKGTMESISRVMDPEKGILLTRIESPTEYPNYYLRDINSSSEPKAVTQFKNPFAAMESVSKEVIQYKREDGLDLSATLYLPADYDPASGEKLPMLMWAYPREYKDKSSASQITSSPYEFIYPYYGSPIYWVMRGYAVLDDAAFPIIGEGSKEPNDSFRKQLVDNAKAAIDAVDDMGYIDRERVAVGGHSYGAFMTANLLSHSNLFAAGIARSGAYNRTLTPFGFQAEERSYWEAPEVYYTMSPFMHAEKMKTPLLLIHGEADNNSGTYPLQSERYFNALKGLGATVRLVMLPKESHGYSARESILHMLWEQDQWLEKYVKNKEAK